ncbi:ABC transporter-like protein [Gracilaria domingensis]|nr:ABC transporter-like protein [Gracilaria domingensis]
MARRVACSPICCHIPTPSVLSFRSALFVAPTPVDLTRSLLSCSRRDLLTFRTPHRRLASKRSLRSSRPSLQIVCTASAKQKKTAATPYAVPKFSPRLAQSSLRALADYYSTLCKTQPFIARRLVLSIISIIVSKLIGVTVPFFFKRIIDNLMAHSAKASAETFSLTVSAILLHGLTRLLSSVSHELRSCVFAKAGQRVGRSITATSFAHLQSLEMAFHNSAQTGAITRVVDRGTRSVLTIFRGLIFAFMPSLFELLLVCGVLFSRFSVWYVAVVLITFAAFIAWTLCINDKLGRVRRDMNTVENDASAKLTDSLINVEAVKAFDNADFELNRYDKVLTQYEELAVSNEWHYAALNVGQGAIYTTGLTLILLRAAQGVVAGTTTVGSVVLLATMLQQLWVPLNFLGWQYREVKQSLIDMQNLFDVLKRTPRVVEARKAAVIDIEGGEIVFDDVTFRYPEPDDSLVFTRKVPEAARNNGNESSSYSHRRLALDRVSFRVPPGKSLALVGSSGSGKSTVTKLLTRLYDATSGRILIDGQDISTATMDSLRHVVSIVPQVRESLSPDLFMNPDFLPS